MVWIYSSANPTNEEANKIDLAYLPPRFVLD